MSHSRAVPWLRTLALSIFMALAAATPSEAIFRFDEIEPRDFRYSDEYFLNVYSYRHRLSHRIFWNGS